MRRVRTQASEIVDLCLQPTLDWFQLPAQLRPGIPRGDGFETICPNGHHLWVPIGLTEVRITGARNNLMIKCQECGASFDAAPGEDVVVNTVGGRLSVRQLVKATKDLRDAVKQSDVADLIELQEALRDRRVPDVDRLHGPLAAWVTQHPLAAGVLTGVLATVIGGLLLLWLEHTIWPDPPPVIIEHQEVVVNLDHDPTDAELERIIREAVDAGADAGGDTATARSK